jgi:hypothetical protein
MKIFSVAVTTFLAIATLSPSAQAQCVATPLQALVGTWTFSTDQLAYAVTPPNTQNFLVSAGRFTASVTGLRGILAITATSSTDGNVTRLETDAGSFQVDDNCAGGTLTFNLSSRPVQFEFYFVNANEITIVANNHRGLDIAIGSARRVLEQVCPVPSLQVLSGTWVFSTNGGSPQIDQFLSSAGRMIASTGVDRAGNPQGILALNVTSSISGSPVRRESDVGRFQVNPDCTGGTLTFNLSSLPLQFDFFLSSNTHLVMVGTSQGRIVVGSARRIEVTTAPSCAAGSLPALSGAWTFATDHLAIGITPGRQTILTSAGRFTASVNGSRGVLLITATSGSNRSVTRLEQDTGTFQVDDDCAGGTLTFNLSSRPVQYEFYFVNANEIRFVGNNVSGGDTLTGSARRVIEQVCPALPLQALSGDWVFSTLGFNLPDNRQIFFLSAAGRFAASVGTDRGGNPTGLLALNVTSAIDGSPIRRESDAGRFQVNADCSGGTLTFNLSSRPVQFDFFFSSSNHFVMVGSNQGDLVVGSGRRFGTN